MRARIEHKRTWYVDSHSDFVLDDVAMSLVTAANRRDIFLRCLQRPAHASKTNTCIYACNTFAKALAITTVLADSDARTAAGVSAWTESLVLDGTRQFGALANQAGVTPDLTGLKLWTNGAADAAADWDALYCYTADPASVVLTEIESILEEYMSSGQALDGFSTARVEIGPEELVLVSKAPLIIAAIADSPDVEHAAGEFGCDVNFSVIVGSRGLASKGSKNYKEVLAYAGAVRSILGDERITLNGVTVETVISNVGGPTPVFGDEEPYLASVVSGKCRFPSMDSDAS